MSPAEQAVEQPVEEQEALHTETETDEAPSEEGASNEGAKPVKGNVHARNRILEREKKELERSIRDQELRSKRMEERLEDLLETINGRNQEPTEPEIEEPEFRHDPMGAVYAKLTKQEREQKRKEEQERQERAAAEERKVVTEINEMILDFAEETPDYEEAVGFLAELEFEEGIEDNPDLTQQEVDEKMTRELRERMKGWVRSGKDPGEELYKRAKRRGWKPQAQRPKTDAKEQIAAENARAKAGSSISKVSGRSGTGRVTAKQISYMSDDEYRVWRDQQKKQLGRTPKMKDLMPEKIRER